MDGYIALFESVMRLPQSQTLGRLRPHVLKSHGKSKNFVTGMTIKVVTVESEHFQAMKSR